MGDKLVRNVVRIPLISRNARRTSQCGIQCGMARVAIGISKTHVARVMCGKCRMQHLTANYNSEQATRGAHKCG